MKFLSEVFKVGDLQDFEDQPLWGEIRTSAQNVKNLEN